MSHTPEPWSYGEDNDGWYVEVAGNQIAFGLTEANARRIVACVNACAGIPTNMLINAGQSAVMAMRPADELVAQRDELLAALDRAAPYVRAAGVLVDIGNDLEVVNAAIASVKGQS